MIPVGTQYQSVRQLRDDLEELLSPELGKFPNGLPSIWVEDRQASGVSGGVAVIIQPNFAISQRRARMGHQSDATGEWVFAVRQLGTEQQFYTALEKVRSLPHFMRETALPFREGVVPQVTFRIAATITRNTWQFSPAPVEAPPPLNQPPSITLTSPLSGAALTAGQMITLSATASDTDGSITSVSFFTNGVLIGTDTTSPHLITWTPSAGSYVLTARATDNNGATTVSSGVSITVTADEPDPVPDPVVEGGNLMGINIPAMGDYFAPYFRDAARQSRPYEAIGGGAIAKDTNGYPVVSNFQVYIWAGGYRRHGTYAITISHPNSYTGGGTLTSLGGTLSNITFDNATKKTTATWIHTDPGESVGALTFQNFTGGITHLKVMRPSSAGSSVPYDETKLFVDSMIDVIGKFDGARLLDTTGVNSSSIRTWSQCTLVTDYSQARDQGEPGSGFGFAGRGLAWEYVADLANEVKARYPHFKALWINIPVLADDDYVFQLFTLLKSRLSNGILLQVEFGNENWNFAPAFIHAAYNRDEGVLEAQQPGSPLGFDGDFGEYTLAWRRQVKRTVDFYATAAAVYGAEVDSKVQFQLQWQQQNGQNTAGVLLKFADKGLNALNVLSKFGLGGSWYYNPNHNDPTLTIDNIWDNSTMNPETWATEWLQVDVHWVAAYSAPTGSLPWNSYEGGPSFDRALQNESTTQEVADRNNTIMKAANYDSRMTPNLIEHVNIRSRHGGNWFYCYKLGGAHDNQYEWAFLYDHDDFNTPKMAGVAAVRSQNRAALTYGRVAPFTINAGNYDINDRGYGNPSNGDYQMIGDETVSYTFRVTTPGTYQFSVKPAGNDNFRLYLGTTTLINSIAGIADTFTAPVSFNCPNPGLYSFRVRNLQSGSTSLKEIRIEAG